MISPGQRTFFGAMASQIVSSVALFTGHLSGEQWVTATGLILAIYGGKSIAETYVTKSKA